ncbi:MAG: sulfatase-like hydrolase/transferase, partial [Planctomycetes bacterium]|nr:sulfatase-like hydrolase/transferase [Planctomycetota bacterium]
MEQQQTTDLPPERPDPLAALWRYFVLSYAAMLVNAGRYFFYARPASAGAAAFAAAALLTYCAVYIFPPAAVVMLAGRVLLRRAAPGGPARGRAVRAGIVYVLAVVLLAAAQVFIYVDVFVFRLWGYHLNSFVLNVLTTPGGIGSMGASGSTELAFALTIAAIVVGQAVLLVLAVKAQLLGRAMSPLLGSSRRRAILVAAWAVLAAGQAVTYGVSKLRWYTPVLRTAESLPFYFPVTFSKLGRRLGWEIPHVEANMRTHYSTLRYPLRPLVRRRGATNYNIVWLTCESLRADMVDPEIMPRTYEFATSDAQWFRRCYGAGGGTRMGMFGMFYGLYGCYWFPMLSANRGPVLFDVLRKAGYQFDCHTSQSFTYPEFNRTVFVDIPEKDLHVIGSGAPGWQRDRRNVANMLAWLDGREANRPFFQFMFFESPHARYYFPPENAIRKPYMKDFNYADLGAIARDPKLQQLVKNRYINACNHLDGQLGRVIDGLRRRGLLDSTIVVITGDHGEEFWERGRWGHAADSFHEKHMRVPLIIHVPGRA